MARKISDVFKKDKGYAMSTSGFFKKYWLHMVGIGLGILAFMGYRSAADEADEQETDEAADVPKGA